MKLFLATRHRAFMGLLSLAFLGLLMSQASAQCLVSISLVTSQTETFDSLATSGTANTTLPTGFFLNENGGGTRDNEAYAASTGSDATGDIYSFGTTAERALGSVASGTLTPAYYGACYKNQTGNVLDAITISYTGEQWRLGNNPQANDKLDFQYSLSETTVNGSDFEDFDDLDFASPVTTGTVGALNGNLAANQTAKSARLSGLNLPDGATIFIRWRDVDTTPSADNGLGVDNLTVAAVNVPTITAIANQPLAVNSTTGPLSFTVGDVETAAASLTVTAASDNQTLVPNANIILAGVGASRTVTVTPATGQSGVATITLTVTDGDGNTATTTFTVIVGTVPQCAAGSEVTVTPGGSGTSSGITLYASTQTNVQASADAQDDAWRTALTSALLTPGTPSGLDGTNKNAMQTITAGAYSYTVSTREMSGGANSAPCQGTNLSIGKTIASNNVTLQSGAPRPTTAAPLAATVYSYSENLGGVSAASGARNALLFEFASNTRAFGAWFGDLEGRTGSTQALVRFFDAAGERIGNDFLIDETNTPYGDKQTRWLGFVSTSANVRRMLVMVGDDDVISFASRILAPQEGQGLSEHLGFIGGTFGEIVTGAYISVSGTVLMQQGFVPRRAKVILSDLNGNTQSVSVNRKGRYTFSEVAPGQIYLVTVVAKGYNFTPQTLVVTPNFDLEEVNFTAFIGE